MTQCEWAGVHEEGDNVTTRRTRGSVADQRARQHEIWEIVCHGGPVEVADLAEATGVSTMTVYRDLRELERLGQLTVERGTVSATASHVREASSQYRSRTGMAVKKRLAHAAAELVRPGWAIIMDDSTTGIPLARSLATRAPLTVVTNYVKVFQEVSETPNVQVLMTGGQYVPWAEAFVGPLAVNALQELRADAVFMSMSAISDGGCFHPDPLSAEVKRAMLASARLKVLYADRTKFTRTALHRVADISDFDVVITEGDLPEEALAGMSPASRLITISRS